MTVSQPHLPSQRTPDGKVGEVPMSLTRSVPTGLQKSTETLNSITDAGSIGKRNLSCFTNTCEIFHVYCYLGKRHSGTLVIIYPLLCNVSLNIKVKQ